jgi:DNA repair exonuclease SbcCD ATPase subunit
MFNIISTLFIVYCAFLLRKLKKYVKNIDKVANDSVGKQNPKPGEGKWRESRIRSKQNRRRRAEVERKAKVDMKEKLEELKVKMEEEMKARVEAEEKLEELKAKVAKAKVDLKAKLEEKAEAKAETKLREKVEELKAKVETGELCMDDSLFDLII